MISHRLSSLHTSIQRSLLPLSPSFTIFQQQTVMMEDERILLPISLLLPTASFGMSYLLVAETHVYLHTCIYTHTNTHIHTTAIEESFYLNNSFQYILLEMKHSHVIGADTLLCTNSPNLSLEFLISRWYCDTSICTGKRTTKSEQFQFHCA